MGIQNFSFLWTGGFLSPLPWGSSFCLGCSRDHQSRAEKGVCPLFWTSLIHLIELLWGSWSLLGKPSWEGKYEAVASEGKPESISLLEVQHSEIWWQGREIREVGRKSTSGFLVIWRRGELSCPAESAVLQWKREQISAPSFSKLTPVVSSKGVWSILYNTCGTSGFRCLTLADICEDWVV